MDHDGDQSRNRCLFFFCGSAVRCGGKINGSEAQDFVILISARNLKGVMTGTNPPRPNPL